MPPDLRNRMSFRRWFVTEMQSLVIVAAGFCLNAFTLGPLKSYGPFFITFERNLNASVGQASLASALMFGSMFLCGPFASMLSNRFGYRATISLGASLASIGAIACSFSQTMIGVEICSAMMGIGCGLTSVPRMALLGARFEEKRSLVNNVVSTGSALLAIPLSLIVQLWIDEYSWRGAILLISGLFLNALPSGLLLTHDKNDQGDRKKKKASLDFVLLKTLPFSTWVLSCGMEMGAKLCASIYLVRYAQNRGVNDYLAASLSSITAFVDLALRPISGYLTSLSHIGPIPIRRIYIYSGIQLANALAVASFSFGRSYEAILASALAYSVFIGCGGALSATLTADLFGIEKLVDALGWRNLVMGAFATVVPPLVGRIVDSTGSYAVPFYAGAVMFLLAAILSLVAHATISGDEVQKKEDVDKQLSTGDDSVSTMARNGNSVIFTLTTPPVQQ